MSYQVGLLPPQTRTEAITDLARHPAVGGWKSLACHVRPELADDPDEAGKWMSRALDDNARDVFHDHHMDRVIRKGMEVGCHVVMHWKCDMLGYQKPDPASGKSRRLTLLEERERMATRDRQIQEEIERLDAQDVVSQIKAVSND